MSLQFFLHSSKSFRFLAVRCGASVKQTKHFFRFNCFCILVERQEFCFICGCVSLYFLLLRSVLRFYRVIFGLLVHRWISFDVNRCCSFLFEKFKPVQLMFSASIRGEICCDKISVIHDDVIKWKHFPRYEPPVRESTSGFPSQRPVTRSFVAWALWILLCSTKFGGHYLIYEKNVKTVIILKHCAWYGHFPEIPKHGQITFSSIWFVSDKSLIVGKRWLCCAKIPKRPLILKWL